MSLYFAFQWHITDECDQCCKHCYIFRETYRLGDVKLKEKGYFITESCIDCGNCYENCPVKTIERR